MDLDDYETYETLVARIRALTKPLKLDWGGKVRRTAVRISDRAKQDLCHFYFMSLYHIEVL